MEKIPKKGGFNVADGDTAGMGWEGEGRNHFDQISAVYNEVITCILYITQLGRQCSSMGRS